MMLYYERKVYFYKGCINTVRPRWNGRNFTDDIFKLIFLNENICILIKTSLKFVPEGQINKPLGLVKMAWHWSGNKPLFEPMTA